MKICAISDTHTNHELVNIPECDLIIHAGDCSINKPHQIYDFLDWYEKLPIKYKIYVAGNHDRELYHLEYSKIVELCESKGIIYLQDSFVIIENIKIYGSPWSLPIGRHIEFFKTEKELAEVYSKIPDDIDILVTHNPAYGILDRVNNNLSVDKNVGSRSLKTVINKLRKNKIIKYHIFGHIHESAGILKRCHITHINASIYEYNKELKTPITFDFEKG